MKRVEVYVKCINVHKNIFLIILNYLISLKDLYIYMGVPFMEVAKLLSQPYTQRNLCPVPLNIRTTWLIITLYLFNKKKCFLQTHHKVAADSSCFSFLLIYLSEKN